MLAVYLTSVFPLMLLTVTTVVFCEFQVFALSCQSGAMTILSATLGRTNNTICTKPQIPIGSGALADTSCRLDVTSRVVDYCEGQTSCVSAAYPDGPLLISFYQSLPDPCAGTFKYTNVTYACGSLPPPGELAFCILLSSA